MGSKVDRVCISLPPELNEQLHEAAHREDVSVSALVRFAVGRYLAEASKPTLRSLRQDYEVVASNASQ